MEGNSIEDLKYMFGTQIFDKKGKTTFDKVVGSAEFVCLFYTTGSSYYSTPNNKVRNAHKKMLEKKYPVQIIYCSQDSCEKDFKETLENLPWPYLAYKDPHIEAIRSQNFIDKESLPKLLVYTIKGFLVTNKGRYDIEDRGAEAYGKWKAELATFWTPD
jgi:hypothetical protein